MRTSRIGCAHSELARRGWALVRYADDFVVPCRTKEEAQTVLGFLRRWTAEAGLTLHPTKTRIVNAQADPPPKRWILHDLECKKQGVQGLRGGGRPLAQVARERGLPAWRLRGWKKRLQPELALPR